MQNLQGYYVYRSQSPDSGVVKVNEDTLLSETLFVDQPVSNDITDYYKVSAVDGYNAEGLLSEAASATPSSIGSSQTVGGIVDSNRVWTSSGNPWLVTGDIGGIGGLFVYFARHSSRVSRRS